MKGMTKEEFEKVFGPIPTEWFDPVELLKALDRGEEPQPVKDENASN